MQQQIQSPIRSPRQSVDALRGTVSGSLLPAASGLPELAHDARSLVMALGLYCDLLAEPGVLTARHRHYLDELRLLSAATRRLVERLGMLSGLTDLGGGSKGRRVASRPVTALPGTGASACSEPLPAVPIENLAADLRANRTLLEAIAGVGVTLRLRVEGGAAPVRLTGEDLTRVLVNLVKNATEGMQSAGTIEIVLRERKRPEPHVLLVVEDNGPGIAEELREKIFAPRFTTKAAATRANVDANPLWSVAHRGLGLSITRSILDAAGGRISAVDRPGGGARLEIELPIRRL